MTLVNSSSCFSLPLKKGVHRFSRLHAMKHVEACLFFDKFVYVFLHKETTFGCVPLGRSRSGTVIQGHSDRGTSNEPMNPCSGWIHQF